MKALYVKTATFVLIVGLLSACGAPAADMPNPTLPPTEEVIPTTEVPTDHPPLTATAAPTATAQTTEPAAAAQGATVSFTTHILPILQSRCLSCHGGDRTEEGLILRTHADLLAGSDNGAVVVSGEATNSLLVELITMQKMPKRGPKLTPPQIQLIADWVNQGALNN